MKRILILLLSMLVALSLTGCFSDDSTDKPTTGTLTADVTYNGTLEDPTAPGTKAIYVYLYSTLTDNAQDAPVYQSSTDGAATIGTEYTVSVTGIAPGNYYVVIFYDYKLHNNSTAGNSDRYIIYNGTQLVADADAVTIQAGVTNSITASFDDTYSLNSGGAYDTSK